MQKEIRYQELIRLQQGSGLTVREFCSNEGIAPSTFYYWRKKLQGDKGKTEKRLHRRFYPFPGEFGKPILAFLEHLKIESRPAKQTLYMYMTALSHFAVHMQEDRICPDNLDAIAINQLISSLQNTQLRVCLTVRRFLRYLFESNITKTDFSIPLFVIKCHRAEKLPSLYNIEEIRKMDASIEKSSLVGKRNYAIFLIASHLGLRASDIRFLQFNNLDWDRNVINFKQSKTHKH